MNNDPKKPLTIAFTGNLTIARGDWEHFMRQLLVPSPALEAPPQTQCSKVSEGDGKLPRLAFSVKETAEILGISQPTVYRLICRGLLKSSLALRNKVIAKSEIERFLKDTSRAA